MPERVVVEGPQLEDFQGLDASEIVFTFVRGDQRLTSGSLRASSWKRISILPGESHELAGADRKRLNESLGLVGGHRGAGSFTGSPGVCTSPLWSRPGRS